MTRLSFYHRIIIGTLIIWVSLAILNFTGLRRIQRIQEDGQRAYWDHCTIAGQIAKVEQSLAELSYRLLNGAVADGRASEGLLDAVAAAQSSVQNLSLRLPEVPDPPSTAITPGKLNQKWSAIQELIREGASGASDSVSVSGDAVAWTAGVRAALNELIREVRDLNTSYLLRMKRDQETAKESIERGWGLLYGLTFGTIILGLVVAVIVAISFARPIYRLAKQANMAVGEDRRQKRQLTHPVDGLRESLDSLVTELSEVKREFEKSQGRTRQSERLAVAGRVAVSLIHEIEKPVAAVKLLLEAGSQSPDFSRSDFQRGLRDIERIESFFEEYLEFSDAQKPRFALVNTNEVVEDALQLVAGESEQRNIKTELEFGEVPPILGDDSMLQEALVNVLLNSLEAMTNGGTLSLTTRLSLAGGPAPFNDTEGIEIFVTDTGPGFPAELVERAFEPFYSTKPKGTGMGLTIVKRIVDLHGGRVRLLNREGGGAIISLFLPLPSPKQHEALDRLEAELEPEEMPDSA